MMKQAFFAVLLAVAGLIAVSAAVAVKAAEAPWTPVEVSLVEDGKGSYKFTNDKGLPFYTSDKDKKDGDKKDIIGCVDGCTGLTWLPVWARNRSEAQGGWSIIIRPDMSKQWAYKGVPIYQYTGDPDELEDVLKADKTWHELKF